MYLSDTLCDKCIVVLQLVTEIKQLGRSDDDGKVVVTVQDLHQGTGQSFGALLGALLTARKQKVTKLVVK